MTRRTSRTHPATAPALLRTLPRTLPRILPPALPLGIILSLIALCTVCLFAPAVPSAFADTADGDAAAYSESALSADTAAEAASSAAADTAAGADLAATQVRTATDTENDAGYWSTYGVPTAKMSTVANNGVTAESGLSYAFDRNLSTRWKSAQANNVNCTLGGTSYTDFHNKLETTFTQTVTLDRILYAAANESDGKGYAKTMRIHYSAQESGDYEGYLTFTSQNSTALMCFEFGCELEVRRICLEWMDVPRYHYYNATASEIIFLQPENAAIDGMFADFTRTTLSAGYDRTVVDALRESLKDNINYEDQFKPLLDRADAILDGTLSFDGNRMYTTNTEAYAGAETGDDVHELYQYGNRRSYSGNTLRNAWFGIDKQSLGLAGVAGETITIYVDAPEGTPLPSICFTQYWGSWRGWQERCTLKRGVNTFTVKGYCLNYCTYPVQQQGGGPFYLENPYFPDEQTGDVSIYIEGGWEYPVYRLGESEKEFYSELASYAAKFSSCATNTQAYYFQSGVGFNLAEEESDHMLVTVQATNTYDTLVKGGLSAYTSMTNWDKVIEELMEYDGIPTGPDSPYYDRWNDCNEHLGINIRLGQPVGAAYGAYQQVGVFTNDWIGAAIYCDGKEGWGMIHEIGHTMDMNDRIVSECSNNMYSKFYESVRFSNGTRGEFAKDVAALTSDRVDHTASSYFDTNRYNYLVWFHLESYHPGFWGEIANLYRYDCAEASGLNSTEKHIYLASRVMGIDLRYYYERFGYRQSTSDAVFTRATQSEQLNTLMQGLRDTGAVSTDELPFWYLDSQQYRLNTSGEVDRSGTYSPVDEDDVPVIRSVEKSAAGYALIISASTAGTNHLGYEILENGEVIGFTSGSSYTDGSTYEDGYTPVYTVRAVDRALCRTAASELKSVPAAGDAVCKLVHGDEESSYNSIAAAVEAAVAGDTVVLLRDQTETGVVVNKSITIRGDGAAAEPLVWSKGSSGNLVKVTGGASVTFDGAKLVMDGNSFDQSGTLVYVESGTATLNGMELRNNRISAGSSSYGGAIRGISGTVNLNGCSVHDCAASYGGGIALSEAKVTANVTGCDIYRNTAYANGGGFCLKGAVYIASSKIRDNTATGSGGGVYIYDGGIGCFNTDFNMSKIRSGADETILVEGNTARDGGGICQNGNTKVFNTVFEENHATANGGAIYSYATSGSHRSIYTYAGTILRYNDAANTGSQVYSKADTNAGPVLRDTVIIARCDEGSAAVHLESGKGGAVQMTGTTAVTLEHAGTLEHVDEVPATCIAEGTAEHWVCSHCGKLTADAAGTRTVTQDDLVLEKTEHAFGEAWESDGSGHWHVCTVEGCDAKTETEEHIHGADGTCTKCGYTTHVHALTKVEAIAADCTHVGNIAYYTCTCGKWFADAAATEEITDHESVVVAALGHEYSDAWSMGDDSGHVHVCTRCGATEPDSVEAHTYDENGTCTTCGYKPIHYHKLTYVAAKAATCTEAGVAAHWECTGCYTAADDATKYPDGSNLQSKGCGMWFSAGSADGQKLADERIVIADRSSCTVPATGHDFSGAWHSDATGHWHVCAHEGCDAHETAGAHEVSGEDGECACATCGYEHSAPLTYVEEVAATCASEGVKAHYECLCGDCFEDAAGTKPVTRESLALSKTDHSYALAWSSDTTSHWHECIVCGEKTDCAAHEAVSASNHVCKDCGYALPHTLEKVDEVAATCTETGMAAHWTCTGCGALFADEAALEETTVERLTLPLAAHKAGNDGTHSNHACVSCGQVFGTHVDGVAATCTENGVVEHWKCDLCEELYRNADGTGPITQEETVIRATGHDFPDEWQCNDSGHWRQCRTCGAYAGATEDEQANVEAHRDDGTGVCEVCGYAIPKQGNAIALTDASGKPAGDIEAIYGESIALPQATATFGEPERSITRDGVTVDAIDGVGTYTVTWRVAAGTSYEGAEASITVKVTRAANEVQLSRSGDIEAEYASEVQLPDASASFGTPVRTLTRDGAAVEAITDAGVYRATWQVAGTDNYESAQATVNVTVTRGAEPTPTPTPTPVNPVTVTFHENGHGTPVAAVSVQPGTAVSAPANPTATGWVFGGWYEDAACTGEAWDFSTPVTADLDLYAKWTLAPADDAAKQVAGSSRYGTAAEIARTAFPDGATGAVVATGKNFPDALGASSLAGLLNWPVVLTESDTLTAVTREVLSDLHVSNIVVIGGEAAVSSDVFAQLESLVNGKVERVWGQNRFETSCEIYAYGTREKGRDAWGTDCIVATGRNYPDALSISGYAYAQRAPIFLTDPDDGLDAMTKGVIEGGGFTRAIVVGGTSAVSTGDENWLKTEVAGFTRLSGSGRYETSKRIAEFVIAEGGTAHGACIATGENFPDALSGSALAGVGRSVMLLVADDNTLTYDILDSQKAAIKQIYFLGGDSAVSPTLRAEARAKAGLQ